MYLDVICIVLVRKEDAKILKVETCLSNSRETTYVKVSQMQNVIARLNRQLYTAHIQINNSII